MKQKNDQQLLKLQLEKTEQNTNYQVALSVIFIICVVGIIVIIAVLYYLRKRTDEYENISVKPKKNQIQRQAVTFKDYRDDLNFLYIEEKKPLAVAAVSIYSSREESITISPLENKQAMLLPIVSREKARES